MASFQVHILASDHTFYQGPCQSLIVPTPQGKYGVLAHHSNMISAIAPGTLHYKLEGQPFQQAAVSSGLLKVENNSVLILVDTVERPEEIDENRAIRAADKAREALRRRRSIREYRFAKEMLMRALSRLKVIQDFKRDKEG